MQNTFTFFYDFIILYSVKSTTPLCCVLYILDETAGSVARDRNVDAGVLRSTHINHDNVVDAYCVISVNVKSTCGLGLVLGSESEESITSGDYTI